MIRRITLYKDFAVMVIRSEMSHRASFFAGIVGQWIGYGATFLTLYIMISSFDTLAGWNASEVLFMYAFNLLSYALAATIFFNPCIQLADKIKTGELDGALTKPVNPLMHEIYMGFNFGYIGHEILSCCIMAAVIGRTRFVVTPAGIAAFLIMLAGAVFMQAAFLLLASAASFFMINDNPILNFLMWDVKQFVNYPITIYHIAIQGILTFLLPFAFLTFYPAAYLLKIDTGSPFPDLLKYLTPAIGVFLFGISIKVWNWGLGKYQSTGS